MVAVTFRASPMAARIAPCIKINPSVIAATAAVTVWFVLSLLYALDLVGWLSSLACAWLQYTLVRVFGVNRGRQRQKRDPVGDQDVEENRQRQRNDERRLAVDRQLVAAHISIKAFDPDLQLPRHSRAEPLCDQPHDEDGQHDRDPAREQ